MTDESTTGVETEQPARARILRAAETLFARDGFDRTPVSQIAKLAGVPHGLVFYYFQTKVGLLLTLISGYSVRLVDVLDEIPDSGTGGPDTPFALVESVLETLREQLRSRTEIRRIVFQEMAAHPEVRQQARTFDEQATDAIAGRLRRGMAVIGLPVERDTSVVAARMLLATTVMSTLVHGPDDPRMSTTELATVLSYSLQHAAVR